MATLNQLDRFFQEVAVDHDGPLTNGEPCWLWQGTKNGRPPNNYGRARFEGASWLCHRYLWIQTYGPVPDGCELDHLCRRPPCVNPHHLDPVSHQVNVQRGAAPAVQRARLLGLTHCKNNHEFTEENTYRAPGTGDRSCLICRKDAGARALAAYVPKPPQTHCRRHHHPLSGENLFMNSEGRRVCRACKRITDRVNQQRYRDRKKAALNV